MFDHDLFLEPRSRLGVDVLLLRELVVHSKWVCRIDQKVHRGTVVTFFAGIYEVKYRVDKCVPYASASHALTKTVGGFRKLFSFSKSLDDALVASHKCTFVKNESLYDSLKKAATSADTQAAWQWDLEFRDSNSVMFVWEGEVVRVADLPPLSTRPFPKIPHFAPCPFFAQKDDPRPGLLVIGTNYQDPSVLSNPDGLLMNLLQQLAPFTHVWGMSTECFSNTATWEKIDIRVDSSWMEAADHLARTCIGMLSPDWISRYLADGIFRREEDTSLFGVTFAHFFPVGVRKVFIMPNDKWNIVDGMTTKFFAKNPKTHIGYRRLTPDQVRIIHPLFCATYTAQQRPEYEATLDNSLRDTDRVESFKGLNPKYPYLLLYSGFYNDLPSEMYAVLSFLWHTCRNTNLEVAAVDTYETEVVEEAEEETDDEEPTSSDDGEWPLMTPRRSPPTEYDIAAHQQDLNRRFPLFPAKKSQRN